MTFLTETPPTYYNSKAFSNCSYDSSLCDSKYKIGEYACIQQSNTDFHASKKPTNPDKSILIEQATNRLRQKVLENKLKSFISSLVEIQSQLEIIKLETSISLQLLPTSSDKIMTETELSRFEKRVSNHIQSLESVIIPEKQDKIDRLLEQHPTSCSSSASEASFTESFIYKTSTYSHMSSTASSIIHKAKKEINTLSSVFSGHNDNDNKALESDYSILGPYDHQKRASKRKKLYQHQQSNCQLYNTIASPTSSPTPSICYSLLKKSTDPGCYNNTLSFLTNKDRRSEAMNSRNAFDDVLSYINNNTDDIEFRNDLSELLASPIFNQQQQQQHNVAYQPKQPRGIVKYVWETSLKWIRFTLVMLLAILINFKREKSTFLVHSRNYCPIIVPQ